MFDVRRQNVMQQIGDGIAIIPNAPVRQRNSDVHYPYRPDSDFYYLTHFPEPFSVAVFAPGPMKMANTFCSAAKTIQIKNVGKAVEQACKAQLKHTMPTFHIRFQTWMTCSRNYSKIEKKFITVLGVIQNSIRKLSIG